MSVLSDTHLQTMEILRTEGAKVASMLPELAEELQKIREGYLDDSDIDPAEKMERTYSQAKASAGKAQALVESWTSLERQTAICTKSQDEYTAKLTELRQSHVTVTREVENLKGKVSELSTSVHKLQSDERDAKQIIQQAVVDRAEVEKSSLQNRQRTEQLDTLEQNIANREVDCNNLEQTLKDRELNLRTLEQEKQAAKSLNDAAVSKEAAAVDRENKAREQLADVERRETLLESKQQEVEKQATDLRQQRQNLFQESLQLANERIHVDGDRGALHRAVQRITRIADELFKIGDLTINVTFTDLSADAPAGLPAVLSGYVDLLKSMVQNLVNEKDSLILENQQLTQSNVRMSKPVHVSQNQEQLRQYAEMQAKMEEFLKGASLQEGHTEEIIQLKDCNVQLQAQVLKLGQRLEVAQKQTAALSKSDSGLGHKVLDMARENLPCVSQACKNELKDLRADIERLRQEVSKTDEVRAQNSLATREADSANTTASDLRRELLDANQRNEKAMAEMRRAVNNARASERSHVDAYRDLETRVAAEREEIARKEATLTAGIAKLEQDRARHTQIIRQADEIVRHSRRRRTRDERR